VEIIPIGSPRRNLISWSGAARALFGQIARDISGQPGVRAGLDLKRPVIFLNRQLAVAGFEDGIAVRLSPQDKERALQIAGVRELRRRDHISMRGMVAVPWSAHDQWQDLMHAAVTTGTG
jgi:hypothetical protein